MRDIDRIIVLVAAAFPDLQWDRGDALRPAQETGRWGFTLPGSQGKVHARSSIGMSPFVVETTPQLETVNCQTIQETADIIAALLRLLPTSRI